MPLTAMPADVAARLRQARLTYPHAGATAGELPGGYRHLRRSAPLGSGQQAFAAAAAALMSWQAHLRAGLSVTATAPVAAPGEVALLGARVGPFRLSAPCRVVYLVDQPCRRGFAYGTLAGHPESGEEAFLISLSQDEQVTFTVTAFSRPATWLARAAGPLATAVQDRLTSRYLSALTR